jgi:small subunit ribosomal protein S16
VSVKIKLKRLGKIRAPYYRIVVADARTKRDGRAIEEIGKYHPKAEPSFIEVNSDRAQHWLSVGAQPTDPVRKILEITGDWQKFKGLPGAEGTLKTAAPKEDRKEIFAAAVKETLGDAAPAPKGKGRSGKDSDATAEKASKPAAKDAPSKGDKPAKAKDEQPAKAKAAGEAKAKDDQPAKAKAKDDQPAKAKAADEAKGDAKAKSDAKPKDDAQAKDKAKEAKQAAEADAEAAKEAEADPAAAAADSGSASGD